MPISIFSPAKINLGLSIIGRDSKQYHLIESVFLPLDFGDEISIAPASETSVSMSWHPEAPIPSELPTEKENLVSRLLPHIPGHWRVGITKKIPLGAGLGGGSSNAGSVLKYFISQGVISKEKALSLASQLGADIPFFLEATPAWVTGIGENCSPLKLPKECREWEVLLVLSSEHCETKKIFSLYRDSKSPFSPSKTPPFHPSQFPQYVTLAKNDLQETVMTQSSGIKQTIELLQKTPNEFCGLSGSGSTCFAVFSPQQFSGEKAKDLSQSLRKLECKTVNAKLLHVVDL